MGDRRNYYADDEAWAKHCRKLALEAEVRARCNNRCEAPGCTRFIEVVHHARGRRVPDADEHLRGLCDAHHRYVHANVEWAYEVGLMVSRVS